MGVVKGAGARGEHEDPYGKADLATLLRQIGSLDETELGDAVTKLLDSPDVTDTLDELRRHIDDLFHRLDADPPEPSGKAELGAEFESHVEALGSKMDTASALLAELTDVLESQTERIETIEQQLGDPDYCYAGEMREPAGAGGAPASPPSRNGDASQTEDAIDAPDPTDVLRELLNDRFDRLEGRIADMEARITDLRTVALQRDQHVRELEERLLVFVDLPTLSPDDRASVVGPAGGAGPTSVQTDVPRFGAPPPSTALRPGSGDEPEVSFVPVPSVSRSAVTAGQGLIAESGQVRADGSQVSAMPSAPETMSLTVAPLAPQGSQVPLVEAVLRAPDHEPTWPPAGAGGDLGKLPEPASGGERTRARAEDRLAALVEREVRGQRDFRERALSTTGGEHPTVMVVDDSADARTILSIYLSKTGYNVVTAASAEDCLAKLRHHVVDAVVLDARMPGADGGHVCRTLREDRTFTRWRDLPIIVYTAYPDECSRAVADAWGATDYVVKGGDMLPLITALVRHTKVVIGAPS